MGRKSRAKANNQKAKNENVPRRTTLNGALFDAFGGGFGFNLGMGDESQSILTMIKDTRGYLISNQGQLLSDVYSTNGIISKFINMPVEDAFSAGFKIKTTQFSDEEIKILHEALEKEGDLTALLESNFWKRLFGGGGIITVTNNDYSKPFDEQDIKKGEPLSFKAFSKWDMIKDGYHDMDMSHFDWDSFNFTTFNYYNEEVDRSRIFIMKGLACPPNKKRQTGGWGLSEMEGVVAHINHFIKFNQLIFEILSEYKVDVLALEGLHSNMMSDPESLHRRAHEVAMIKDMKSMLVLDKNDQFYARNLTFAGIPEILTKTENHLASVFRIPATRFWGISASGFSSGNEDLEAYNVSLRSIRTSSKPILHRMVQLRCLQLFGQIPEDLEIEFNPLRDETVTDSEARKNGEHARLMEARREGIITDDQYKEGVDKGGLLPVKIGG